MSEKDYFFRDSSWSAYANSQGLSRRLRKRIDGSVREGFERAGHIFATSEWAKAELIQEGGRAKDITVVGTGVGNLVQPYFDKADYANKRTLCIAKVRLHNKGLDLLLEGFRIAHSIDSELRLDLVVPVGTVPDQAGVSLYSSLPGDKLRELYRSVSLYAMPARYEPWGLVYLEAQLSALPILGSSNCAFPELANFGANGYILPNLTPENIAASLLEAHASPEQLRKKGQAGLIFAQNFTWRRTVDEMLRVIDANS
jgi:glycosyltransferase involved in cell wall biosynthesis